MIELKSVTDAYDNLMPLEYGPDAPRPTVWGLPQPASSTEPVHLYRTPTVITWRLFTPRRSAHASGSPGEAECSR